MAASRVYVGGIPHDCRQRDLEKFFRGFGKLRDILIKNGYGFVEFENFRDADDAVYEMNGRDLMGMRVTVEHARGVPRVRGGYAERDRDRRPPWMDRSSGGPPQSSRGRNNRYGPPTRTPYRCYVENLSSRISWQDLKDYMRKAGTITFADAHRHRRNEGIVEFASYSDLKRAIDKLDDTELCGRRIRLINDYRRSSRSRSRSRSRSGRRSRSRSRSRSGHRSRSRSRSRSRRSHSDQKSRSRSRSRDRSTSRRRSRSRSKSQSRSKSRSRSLSHRSCSRPSNKSGSRSRSRSAKRESRSRSRSRQRRSMSRSQSPAKDEQSNGRKRGRDSRSNSKSRSRSRDWSPSEKRHCSSKSRSRSRSYTPERNGEQNGHHGEQ